MTATTYQPMYQNSPHLMATETAGGQLSQLQMTSSTNLDTPSSYEQSRRQISSVVVAEEILGPIPDQEKVTYIEVPVIKEVIKYVPKAQIVEVEKIVPKYEITHVEKIVEVPQIAYIDKPLEKVVEHIPGQPLIHEIKREVTKHVPKVEYIQTEKIVEIPGDVIEIPVIHRNAEQRDHPEHIPDKEIPVVVAQTIRPVLSEKYDKTQKVDLYQYNPQSVPVDVLVAKPVASKLIPIGAVSEKHTQVDIPAPQFNTILREINDHLPPEEIGNLPYLVDLSCNQVTFLHPTHTPGVVEHPRLQYRTVEQMYEQERQLGHYEEDNSIMQQQHQQHILQSQQQPCQQHAGQQQPSQQQLIQQQLVQQQLDQQQLIQQQAGQQQLIQQQAGQEQSDMDYVAKQYHQLKSGENMTTYTASPEGTYASYAQPIEVITTQVSPDYVHEQSQQHYVNDKPQEHVHETSQQAQQYIHQQSSQYIHQQSPHYVQQQSAQGLQYPHQQSVYSQAQQPTTYQQVTTGTAYTHRPSYIHQTSTSQKYQHQISQQSPVQEWIKAPDYKTIMSTTVQHPPHTVQTGNVVYTSEQTTQLPIRTTSRNVSYYQYPGSEYYTRTTTKAGSKDLEEIQPQRYTSAHKEVDTKYYGTTTIRTGEQFKTTDDSFTPLVDINQEETGETHSTEGRKQSALDASSIKKKPITLKKKFGCAC